MVVVVDSLLESVCEQVIILIELINGSRETMLRPQKPKNVARLIDISLIDRLRS